MPHFQRDGGGPRKGGGKKFGERPGGSWQRSSPPGRDGGRPAMHRATCNECGNSCEVPFIPTGSRPILCSNCFRKGQGPIAPRMRENNAPQRPSFNDREMFQATCNKCGNTCEVPFRPTGEKPVFCKNCFAGGGGRGEYVPQQIVRPPSDYGNEQLKAINQKLDTVLKALSALSAQRVPATMIESAPAHVDVEKKPASAKKGAKKKAPGKKK